MYKIYKKSIRSHKLEEITKKEISQTGVWIQITNPEPSDIALVEAETGLTHDEALALVDDLERPRIEKNEHNKIIVFHIPFTHEGQMETNPLVIIVGASSLITITRHESPILRDFVQGALAFTTTMKSRFILLLLKRINYYFERNLKSIDLVIDDIEKNIAKYTDTKEINNIFTIKRSLIYFHTAIIANGKVLRRIVTGNFLTLYDEDKEILEDLIIDNDQTQEIVSIYSSIVTSSLDAYASVVANNMNVVMKSLTVATITLAIPTTIASLWGMNVQVPMSTNPLAFYIIMSLALLLTLSVTYFYLKRK